MPDPHFVELDLELDEERREQVNDVLSDLLAQWGFKLEEADLSEITALVRAFFKEKAVPVHIGEAVCKNCGHDIDFDEDEDLWVHSITGLAACDPPSSGNCAEPKEGDHEEG